MNSQLTYDDLKSFLRRRKSLCLVTFCVIFGGAVILAVVLPSVYRSQATIRITEQQISEDYIKSVTDTSTEERLQRLTGTIMRYSKLQKIIEKYNLYPKLQAQGLMSDAVQEIKAAIKVEPTITEIINPKSGRTIPVTSALILSFQGDKPEQVQKVTQELANLYVEEDIKKREEITSATTGFLEDEIDRVKKLMQEQEKKISEYKRDHIGELPENSMSNRQAVASLENNINQIDSRISYLEDRKIFLNGQLGSISPVAPIKSDQGELIRNPYERLKIKRAELQQLQARFSDKHPDVIRAKRELTDLESELGVKPGSTDLKSGYGNEKPDNPAYITLLSEIQAADAEIRFEGMIKL